MPKGSKGHIAQKAVNRWLTSHGHRPLDRKVGYVEFAHGIINVLRLQSRDFHTKNQAKAFVCDVARSLEGGTSAWASPMEKAA